MARTIVSPQVKEALGDRLQTHGIELLEVVYRRENNGRILRIFIDTAGGVDSDTCVTATRAVKDYIDDLDELDYDYLEVSSPGIDRVLNREQDFVRFKGAKVIVKTREAIGGSKKLSGLLGEVDQNDLHLDVDGQDITVNRKLINQVRLNPDI